MPDQVQEFINSTERAVNPEAKQPVAVGEPRVPFQTDLKLTRQQEDRMIDHAFRRLRELEAELGRDVTTGMRWWENQSGASFATTGHGVLPTETFMGKRCRFDGMFLNDWSWRPYCYPSPNIFQDSNFAIPLVRRIARQMIARAKNAFFGSEPWFSVDPAPVPEWDAVNDAERALRIERFTRFKLRESNTEESLGKALARAFITGEVAVKTTYVVRDQLFNTEARVLHGIDGQPIRAADGDYITEQDSYIDAEDGTGRMVLARDRQTPMEEAPIWQNIPIERRQVLFEGARSEPIYFKDFLCPMTATDVQTADCVVHLYDKNVAEFVNLVVKAGMVADDTEERIAAARKIIALVKEISSNTATPKAAATQDPRPGENYEAPPSATSAGPTAGFAEFYLWFDANGDGIAENVCLICDRQTRAPVYYNHVAGVAVDGLRPIEIVRVNPVEGRWYGQGVMELFSSYQDLLDIQWNRWNYNQSKSGRVVLWTPNNTVEGDNNPHLVMEFGQSYTKKPGMKKEDVVEVVYLSDLKFEQTHLMLQHTEQLLMNEAGVGSMNDAQAAGMATSELATGVIQVAKSGDELFQPMLSDLRGPAERILMREIGVILANINPKEVYDYLEGDDQKIGTLTPEDVRGLRFKTRITLVALKDNQELMMSAQAVAIAEKFYLLPFAVQQKLAPLYRRQLKKLDPQSDPDMAIAPIEPAPAAQEQTKTTVSVAAKLELLTPQERVAVMDKLGVNQTEEQAANAPKPPPTGGEKKNGSGPKLGDAGSGGGTEFSAQLTQVPTMQRS